MHTQTRMIGKSLGVATRAMLLATVVLGVGYTAVITGVGQLAFPAQANGSPVRVNGAVVGSALIGQAVTDAAGEPLPEFFQPRPSAAGEGYDGGGSGASNFGPEHPEFVALIAERQARVAAANGVPVSAVPADAVTASSSGLDPHISPEYARIQVARVAAARGLSADTVAALLAAHTENRDLGYLGEPRVNVLLLNAALENLGN